MRVAYLNDDGTIGGIGRIGDNAVLNDKMIKIDDDFDTTNKKWNGSDWESYTPEPAPAPELEPTEEEIVQAEMLLNQAQIMATQQEQDEVLAAILLNQMEV